MPRKRSSSNVKAAIAGSKEVTAELEGNSKAAEKFGKEEYQSRSPRQRKSSKMRKGSSSPRQASTSTGANAGSYSDIAIQYEGTPTSPSIVKGYSNHRTFGSYGWQDPYASNAPGLFGILCTGGLDALSGLNFTIPAPAGSESQIATWVANLPFQLFAIASGKGLNVSGFLTTTLSQSILAYVNFCATIYSELRLFQALMSMSGFNNAMTRVASNLLAQEPIIKDYFTQLAMFPMPSKLYEMIDKMNGVFMDSDAETAPFFIGYATNDNLDLGDPTQLATELGAIGAIFQTLRNGVTIPSADLANITRVFSFLYGLPERFGPAPKHMNTQDLMMMTAQALHYVDSGTTNHWAAPSLDNTVTRGIPMWVYGDPDTLDPQWFTLWRPYVYWLANNVTTANEAPRGMLGSFDAAKGTQIEYYDTDSGALTVASFTGAGAAPVANIGTLGVWDFLWAPVVRQETAAANQVNTDARALPGWTRMYALNAELIDESIEFQKDIWIRSISSTSLRVPNTR